MKKLLLVFTFIFASFFQLSANYSPKISTLNVVINEKALVLSNSVTHETKVLLITDQFGDIVFEDRIEESKRKVKYDLESLPNGNYKIRIKGGNSVDIYEAVISNEAVHLVSSKSFFRPTIEKMNHKVLVNSQYLNEEDIQISIYDDESDLIYRFNHQKTGSFQKSFNLEKLGSGEYNVIVSTEFFSSSTKIAL